MIEDFFNALQNFRVNKTRTFLSLLGVIIGVASVIVVTALGASATANVKESFGSSGLDTIRIFKGFMNNRNSNVRIEFDEKFRNTLYNNFPNTKKVFFTNSSSPTLVKDDLSVSTSCQAIETGYLQANSFELAYGDYFSVSDNVSGAQKIILGSEIAEALFPDGKPIGKTIIMIEGDVRFGFEVVGVLKKTEAMFETPGTTVYIPRGFYIKKISPENIASEIVVQVDNQENSVFLADSITAYATEETGSENSIYVNSMQSMIKQYEEVTNSISLLLSGIAAISLLVGGIGIMNIMIVTVTERRKEIGIRKALGATPFAIKTQFLVESATISLFGGFFGIILGYILSAVAVYIMSWQFSFDFGSAFAAFLFSAFVGVFFGYSPASRAAKLDPVEALSSE